MAPVKNPLIVALDVDNEALALDWVRRLSHQVGCFKVGMQLFYQSGPRIVETIKAQGVDVFLDLKLHDIPNTVASACRSLKPLEPKFLTLHAGGGLAMMQAAQDIFAETATQLLGITVLTSLDQASLSNTYPLTQPPDVQIWVSHLAHLAQKAGLPGVVCSAQETALLRHQLGPAFCLVNPGIRLQADERGDQQRVLTPEAAIKAGASYLVVGRPILNATNPEQVVQDILMAIEMVPASGERF